MKLKKAAEHKAPAKPMERVARECVPVRFALDKGSNFEAGTFKGLALVWGSVIDTYPDPTIFEPGAFTKTIRERFDRIKILLQHDMSGIWIGLPTQLAESKDGLIVEASLNTSQSGRDAAEALKHAAQLGKLDAVELSIGFDPVKWEMVEQENGQMFRVITEARLWEISLVNFGADRQTKVLEAASLRLQEAPQLLSLLSDTPRLISLLAEPSETQEGRKLSAKTLASIQSCITALQSLIDSARKADPNDDEDDDDEGYAASLETEKLGREAALAEADFSELLSSLGMLHDQTGSPQAKSH